MTPELEVVWRGVEPSQALTERIRYHVAQISGAGPCRVTVGLPHRRHRRGAHYEVKLELWRDGRAIEVSRDAGRRSEDPYAAVNAAFGRLERKLANDGSKARAKLRSARRAG